MRRSDSDSGDGGALTCMLPRLRSRPITHFIERCLPRAAKQPPAGRDWIHEIQAPYFRRTPGLGGGGGGG
jgi:hypothetical protein